MYIFLLCKVPGSNCSCHGHVLAGDDELGDPEDAEDVDEERGDGHPVVEEGVRHEAGLDVLGGLTHGEENQEGDGPAQNCYHQSKESLKF